jgi:hypothetical protein
VNEARIKQETLLQPGDVLDVAGLKLQLAARTLNAYAEGPDHAAFLDHTVESPAFVRADLTQDAFESTADEAAKVALQFWDQIRSRR